MFVLDLADFYEREDFEARIYPDLSLLAKDMLTTPKAWSEGPPALAIRELLTGSGTKTLAALREELKTTKLMQLTVDELADVMTDVLS